MAKYEPIAGRHVWVPFAGTEHRIFVEENDPASRRNLRVIALDLPRHGQSSPACEWYLENEEYTLTAQAYDFACPPELTEEAANKPKDSECMCLEEIGHFPMRENPEVFNRYLMPDLEKVLAL